MPSIAGSTGPHDVSNADWMHTLDRSEGAATVKVTTDSGATVVYRVPTRSLIEYASSVDTSSATLARA